VSFSERYGYKPIREIIQIESIDEPLKNGLWSLLKIHVWDHVHYTSGMYGGYFLSNNEDHYKLCERLWFDYFKKPLDQLDGDWKKVLEKLRRYFFESEWYELYDFIEFIANNFPKYNFRDRFMQSCNILLEKEMSAYRFVGGIITRITEQHEVAEIEKALETSAGPVSTHLRRSIELLSNREKPDYRNSIKESISAVESFVSITVGVEKGTLGQLSPFTIIDGDKFSIIDGRVRITL